MSTTGTRRVSEQGAVWVCAFAAGLLSIPLPAEAQDGQLPAKIGEALEANVKSLSPFTVAWKRTRASDLPAERLLPTLKREVTELDFMAPAVSRFQWQGGKFRLLDTSHLPQVKRAGKKWVVDTSRPLGELRQEISFDGQAAYNGNLACQPPMVRIDSIERMVTDAGNVDLTRQHYLREAGYVLPSRPSEVRDKQPARSILLSLLAEGAKVVRVGQEAIDGATNATVEVQRGDQQVRFYLDPARNYAVRRREERLKSGELAVVTDCTEFTKLPRSGLWLPKRIEVTWNWRPEAPTLVKPRLLIETYTVSELSDEPIPDSQFVLKYEEPGSFISDSRISGAEKVEGGRITYQQPANPADLEEVIAAAKGDYRPSSRAKVLWRVLGANAALLAAAVGFIVWRHRRGA
jgi:hypothetical protein